MRRLSSVLCVAFACLLAGCSTGPSDEDINAIFAETVAEDFSSRIGLDVADDDPDVLALARTLAEQAERCTDESYWRGLSASLQYDGMASVWAIACTRLFEEELSDSLRDEYASIIAHEHAR